MPKESRRRPLLRDIVHGQGIILEEIRSQNRATIEAIEATRVALEAKIDDVDRGSKARDAVLEAAVRQNSADIRKNSVEIQQNSVDIQKHGASIQKHGASIRKNGASIRKNGAGIRKNTKEIRKNGEDIRVLTARVEALGPLDQRVSAIERRPSGQP